MPSEIAEDDPGLQAQLKWAGLIGLAVQGVIMAGMITILWRFTTDMRFKPVYGGWLAAASIVAATARRNDLIRLVTTAGTDSDFAPGSDHVEAIMEYLAAHNEDPRPFVWTAGVPSAGV